MATNVFTLRAPDGTIVFNVDSDGVVTALAGFTYSGADDFGSTGIKADVIAESTAAAGVTIDGALIKDANIVDSVGFYDAAAPTKVVRMDAGNVTAGQTRVLAMPDANVTMVSDPASYTVLGAITNGNGAAKIGVEDSGAKFTGATVEAVLAEAATEYQAYRDQLVVATITVPDTAGGGTDALATVSLKRALDNATDPGTICQVLILACDAQYEPVGSVTLVATVTFATATTGTIVASGSGWALIATDAAGDFACTISNSADETVYFRVITAEAGSNAGQRCSVVFSNSDAAAWSA